jgi:cellulose biosynthesis protein BcsQ
VESTTMGEGKTTVLGNLAMNMVKAGIRVLMVDCDLQRPTLHHLFGIENEGGLAQAMALILSHKISAGQLYSHSMDDLFFLIALKKKSGDLIITNNSQIATATFQDGRLLHLQIQNDTSSSRLGIVLLRGGFITESQLEEALSIHHRTGQALGYILINTGYIIQEKLQGPLRLRMEEHLQRLFSWKQGGFVFKQVQVETYEHERIYFGEDYTPITQRLGRLSGSRLLESVILSQVKSCQDGELYVMPAGTASGKISGALNLTLLTKFLDILKQRFDVVLVDTAPLLEGPDVTPLNTVADRVIFVVKAGNLSVKTINEATRSVPRDKIMGAILNQVKVGRDDYYYK